jgi:hypothetical protein
MTVMRERLFAVGIVAAVAAVALFMLMPGLFPRSNDDAELQDWVKVFARAIGSAGAGLAILGLIGNKAPAGYRSRSSTTPDAFATLPSRLGWITIPSR